MRSSSGILLTSSNYFQWKFHMEYLLKIKGLYKTTLGIEDSSTGSSKKDKCKNRNDSTLGLIVMSISIDL